MTARRNQTPEETCPTAFPAMIRSAQLTAQTPRGAHQRGSAYYASLRRTGQSECELPHITLAQRSIIVDEKEFASANYAANVIGSTIPSDSRGSGLSFRLGRGTVRGICGCCHCDVFRRPIGTGRPFESEHSERRPQPGNPGAVDGAPAHSTGRSVQPNGASLTRLSPRNERGEEIGAQTGGGRCMVQS
jgi:hypothetical protein